MNIICQCFASCLYILGIVWDSSQWTGATSVVSSRLHNLRHFLQTSRRVWRFTHLTTAEISKRLKFYAFTSVYKAVYSSKYVVKSQSPRPCARAWQWRGGTNVAPADCLILSMSLCALSICTYYMTGNSIGICVVIWNTFWGITRW